MSLATDARNMNTLARVINGVKAAILSKVTSVTLKSLKLGFGLFSLAAVWANAVIFDGALWSWDRKEFKQELAAAQKKYWSLGQEPLPGFKHAFFKTIAGVNLHYVVNCDGASVERKNVVIFIHGFPDSFLIWRYILQSPDLLRNHILVAVDLPGYGGSDSLPSYGPYEMLESLSEFIIGMRRLHLQEYGKLVVVTHDWGAVVGARLASEAADLADHWILTSVMIPSVATSNALSQTLLCRQMLHTWIRSPLNVRLLQNSLRALQPITSQFQKSFYIFCFHLPRPLSNFFVTFGNYWFLRLLHNLTKGKLNKGEKSLSRLNTKEAAEAMAMSIGPGSAQLNDFHDLKYGGSVANRIRDRGMSEKSRIYREGLFFEKWDKSLEMTAALFEMSAGGGGGGGGGGGTFSTHSSLSSGTLLDKGPDGALRAPATLIMGEKDPAFGRHIGLDGIKDFLVKGSQVVLVKGAGHWLPLEPIARRILEKTIQWALVADIRQSDGDKTPFATMSEVRIIEAL